MTETAVEGIDQFASIRSTNNDLVVDQSTMQRLHHIAMPQPMNMNLHTPVQAVPVQPTIPEMFDGSILPHRLSPRKIIEEFPTRNFSDNESAKGNSDIPNPTSPMSPFSQMTPSPSQQTIAQFTLCDECSPPRYEFNIEFPPRIVAQRVKTPPVDIGTNHEGVVQNASVSTLERIWQMMSKISSPHDGPSQSITIVTESSDDSIWNIRMKVPRRSSRSHSSNKMDRIVDLPQFTTLSKQTPQSVDRDWSFDTLSSGSSSPREQVIARLSWCGPAHLEYVDSDSTEKKNFTRRGSVVATIEPQGSSSTDESTTTGSMLSDSLWNTEITSRRRSSSQSRISAKSKKTEIIRQDSKGEFVDPRSPLQDSNSSISSFTVTRLPSRRSHWKSPSRTSRQGNKHRSSRTYQNKQDKYISHYDCGSILDSLPLDVVPFNDEFWNSLGVSSPTQIRQFLHKKCMDRFRAVDGDILRADPEPYAPNATRNMVVLNFEQTVLNSNIPTLNVSGNGIFKYNRHDLALQFIGQVDEKKNQLVMVRAGLMELLYSTLPRKIGDNIFDFIVYADGGTNDAFHNAVAIEMHFNWYYLLIRDPNITVEQQQESLFNFKLITTHSPDRDVEGIKFITDALHLVMAEDAIEQFHRIFIVDSNLHRWGHRLLGTRNRLWTNVLPIKIPKFIISSEDTSLKNMLSQRNEDRGLRYLRKFFIEIDSLFQRIFHQTLGSLAINWIEFEGDKLRMMRPRDLLQIHSVQHVDDGTQSVPSSPTASPTTPTRKFRFKIKDKFVIPPSG